MSFEFPKRAWLQYLGKKLDYFTVPPLGAQDASLMMHLSPAPSVLDEGQARPVASAVADDGK